MKLKTFTIAALATVTLASSCSKQTGSPEPDAPATSEKTYVAVTLTTTKAGTKADTYSNLEPTDAESAIGYARLYIADAATGIIEDMLSFTGGNTTQTAYITLGAKKFLALANFTPSLTITPGTTTLDELQYQVLDLGNDITTVGDPSDNSGTFWMTSTEIITRYIVIATEEDVKTPGHNNNITIPVGRAMAKIGVYFDKDEVKAASAGNNPGGYLESAQYRVRQNPNVMYVFGETHQTGILRTPYMENMIVNLGGYFDTGTAFLGTGLTSDDYHEAPCYMIENSNLIPRYGNVNYVSIKAVFVPDAYDDNPAATITPGDTFYRIKTTEADGAYSYSGFYQTPPSVGANQEVVTYSNGDCYYRLILRDTETFGVNKYTVRRNTYWDVVITDITACGFPSEGDYEVDPGPEVPIEGDSWVRAAIQVVEWERVGMPGTLEGV